MPGVHKITPILEVETVEPELPFWVDRLGFRKSVEVPDGDRLGFVILVKEGVEVMLQSTRSLKAAVSVQAPTTGAGPLLPAIRGRQSGRWPDDTADRLPPRQ